MPDGVVEVFSRVGDWMSVNGEAIYETRPLEGVELPEGWMGSVNGENIYLFPPKERPSEDVEICLKSHEIDSVQPSILGQPDTKVEMLYEEEPAHEDKVPAAYVWFILPVEAWEKAPEGMPVLRLENDR